MILTLALVVGVLLLIVLVLIAHGTALKNKWEINLDPFLSLLQKATFVCKSADIRSATSMGRLSQRGG